MYNQAFILYSRIVSNWVLRGIATQFHAFSTLLSSIASCRKR